MDSDSKLSEILGFLTVVYVIVSQIATLVFFIGYCRTDPILKIILLDSILSEIKGVLWIFFIW